MSRAQELIAQLKRNRQFVVDLGDGLSVTCLRPTETGISKMSKPLPDNPELLTIDIEHSDVAKAAIGWEGFTEAALFGSTVGSSDPIEFDPDLWAALAEDDRGWFYKVATKMLEAINEHNLKKIESAKNSTPA